MNDELQEHRERVDAAWKLIQADVIRVKEAFRQEIDQVRQLRPKVVFNQYPLAFAGAAAGLGFVLGFRGGRSRGTLRALSRGAGGEVAKALSDKVVAPKLMGGEKSLARRLGEVLLLAVAQRGASYFAEQAVHRFEAQQRKQEEQPHIALSGQSSAGL